MPNGTTVPSESTNPERATRVEGWSVYILECDGGWLYVGQTRHLDVCDECVALGK